jgi:hypothetical protein
VALVRDYDEVLQIFLLLAVISKQLLGIGKADLRSYLVETIECIDRPY